MDRLNKLTYEQSHTENFMSKIDAVINWLKDKNLSADLSRYSRYRGYIEEFYEKGDLKEILILEPKFKRLNEAAQEIIQIVQIYEAFKDVKSDNFDERLKKVIAGKDFFEPNSSEDSPRDFLYELLIAARFQKLGYKIDFDQLTDVVAQKGEDTVYVECKRIKSVKGLEKNFSKACKQLEKVIDAPNKYGIVFIDVYNCFSDKLRDYEYGSILEMRKEVQTVMANNFGNPNNKLINRILDAHVEAVSGVAFTATRCLWLSDVTPQFYGECKVIAPSQITDEKFEKLKEILQ